ncbi:MAG: branched-chain amino acid ABC transporter permease [Anaerolineae bacterium]|nr:branched-chain amino acid ABC transporter permease [Anaerolineae bacterium]
MQAILASRERRSWAFVLLYLGVLLGYSLLDYGFDTTMLTGFSGVLQGVLVFMVAAGFSIIFGLLDVLNFAQGAFFMVGAYVGVAVYTSIPTEAMSVELAFLIGMGAAILTGLMLGAVTELGLVRPLYKRPVFTLLMTFGLAAVLREVVRLYWGPAPLTPPNAPPALTEQFVIFGQPFSVYRLFIIGMGLVMMIGVLLLLRFTRIGIIIRAGLEDREMVQALGINVHRVFTLVFVVGTVVATLGGFVVTPFRGAYLEMGDEFLLSAIIVVIIGGLGSYEGTAVASIMVGLTRAVAERVSLEYFGAPVLAELSILAVMVFVLLVQPSGLFGREE